MYSDRFRFVHHKRLKGIIDTVLCNRHPSLRLRALPTPTTLTLPPLPLAIQMHLISLAICLEAVQLLISTLANPPEAKLSSITQIWGQIDPAALKRTGVHTDRSLQVLCSELRR